MVSAAAMIQFILAAFIFIGGVIKVIRMPFQVEHWHHYDYPLWFMTVTGIIELVCGAALFAGLWNRYAAIGSVILLAFILLRAIHAHIFRAHQSIATTLPAVICLVLCAFVFVRSLKGA